MKLITMSITIGLLVLGYGAGWYSGHYQGRDEIHSAMLDNMNGLAAGQMGVRR